MLTRVQSLIDEIEQHGQPDRYLVPVKISEQFPDIAIDVQTLFFCDSPMHPLYAAAMRFNHKLEMAKRDCRKTFNHSDFIELKSLLTKYLESQALLEVKD